MLVLLLDVLFSSNSWVSVAAKCPTYVQRLTGAWLAEQSYLEAIGGRGREPKQWAKKVSIGQRTTNIKYNI